MLEILKNRKVTKFTGSDAGKFLQNFTTNDVQKKQFTYNYLLNNQGRFLFDFFVFNDQNNIFYVDISTEQVDAFSRRLNMYKLRSDVEITDLSEDYIVTYSKETVQNSIHSTQDPRFNKLGIRSIVKKAKLDENNVTVDSLYMNDKYQYAIIDGDTDLEFEKSIPIEFGAEELGAIDFNKGCYVGQEVISRAKHQGVVRKKIYQLSFGTNIALNTSLVEVNDSKGNKIGKVCSYYKNLAIVQLREEKFLGLEEKKASISNQEAEISIPEWRL